MKRLDMIMKVLENTEHVLIDPLVMNYIKIEFILAEFEALGMLPPAIKVSFDLKKQDGKVQKSYSIINRWELSEDKACKIKKVV